MRGQGFSTPLVVCAQAEDMEVAGRPISKLPKIVPNNPTFFLFNGLSLDINNLCENLKRCENGK
jgi:hypothetical protein